MSIRQVCEATGYSRWQVARFIEDGTLAAIRLTPTSDWRVIRADLNDRLCRLVALQIPG